MTAEPDLLPCPFCGSENIDPKGWASTDSAGPACDDCGAGAGGVRGTLQDNIAAWNRRACVSSATEALRAEVAEWKRVASAQAELHGEAEARAERLAEALRGLLDVGDKFTGDPDEDAATWVAANDAARAALEQEEGR